MKIFKIFFVVFLVLSVEPNVNAVLLKSTLKIASNLVSYTQAQLNAFVNFATKYDKNYASPAEEALAFKNFIENLNVIDAQNAKFKSGKSKFQTAVWNHTDESIVDFIENFARYLGTARARSYGNEYPSENIPESLNYTKEGLVNRVMYQGYCGGCWAFASVGALEGQLKKKTGKLVKLSEQNLIDCNSDPEYGSWGCNGGNMQLAFDYLLHSGGINDASSYRYRGKGNYSCNFNPDKSIDAVHDFVEVASGNETTLMLALANVGPIAVAIDASLVTFQNYKEGIYDDPDCTGMPNHAVLLVGYGPGYWLVKNSWGTKWGEQGYVKIARNKNNLCNIAFDPVYPVV